MKFFLETGFLFAWSAFVWVWAINVILNSGFRFGRQGGTYVTPATHPVVYWTMVTLAILSGLVVIIVAIQEIRKQRK